MHQNLTDEQLKQACNPHELFLINLIFNHILLFAAALGAARSYPVLLLPIPVISASILLFSLWRARQTLLRSEPWFVTCHWQVVARRSRMFLGLLGVVVGLVLAILFFSGGNPRPQHWALLGAVVLPTMLVILVLVILETESMQQARHGQLPKWVQERFPNPATESSSAP